MIKYDLEENARWAAHMTSQGNKQADSKCSCTNHPAEEANALLFTSSAAKPRWAESHPGHVEKTKVYRSV